MTPPYPSSIGMSVWANVPTEKESTMVTVLRQLGAVLYVKTNVPTAMMMSETNNRVWGETRNPIHKTSTCGGSSGGEGALIAIKASPLGVGTDIGGSIRFPSAHNHLYGLKPSFGRFPNYGGRSGIPGQEFINSICGPMSTSLQATKMFCEAVLSEEAAPWDVDAKLIPMPWRKNVIQPKGRKLRIGILGITDGNVTCHPPVERAINDVARKLKEAGHEVFDWAPETHRDLVSVLTEAFDEFGSGAINPQLKAFQEPEFGAMTRVFKGDNPFDQEKLRNMILRRNALQKEYLDRWMATRTDTLGPMDCIIAPVAVSAAPRLGLIQTLDYIGFTGFANVIGKSACFFSFYLFVERDANCVDLRGGRYPIVHVPSYLRRQVGRLQERRQLDAVERKGQGAASGLRPRVLPRCAGVAAAVRPTAGGREGNGDGRGCSGHRQVPKQVLD